MRTSSTGVGQLLVTLFLLLSFQIAQAALPSHPAVHTFEPTAQEYPLSAAGYAVAMRNSTALLGMIGIQKVAIFTRTPSGWQRTGTINAPAGTSSFGRLIAHRDSTTVIADDSAAYVYKLVNGSWRYTQKLKVGSTLEPVSSLAYQDNLVVVGHSRWERAGRVLAFSLNANGKLVQTTTLTPRDSHPADSFGHDVAMSAEAIVVGAPYSNGGGAYVFRKNSSGWSQSQRLRSAQSVDEGFGYSVAINNGIIAVGAPYEDFEESGTFENPLAAEGAAYVYLRNSSGTYAQAQRIRPTAADAPNFISFGEDIQMSGTRIAVAGREFTYGPGRYAQSLVFTYNLENGRALKHGLTSMFQAASFCLSNNWLMAGQPLDIAGGGGGMATLFDVNWTR